MHLAFKFSRYLQWSLHYCDVMELHYNLNFVWEFCMDNRTLMKRSSLFVCCLLHDLKVVSDWSHFDLRLCLRKWVTRMPIHHEKRIGSWTSFVNWECCKTTHSKGDVCEEINYDGVIGVWTYAMQLIYYFIKLKSMTLSNWLGRWQLDVPCFGETLWWCHLILLLSRFLQCAGRIRYIAC